MTQEEKQLLLIDLCERLPYGIKVFIPEYNEPQVLCGIDVNRLLFGTETTNICRTIFGRNNELHFKPYLRPMSSMTEEESEQCSILLWHKEDTLGYYDYLNSIHIDYRGLIDKGLALEAPEGIYSK